MPHPDKYPRTPYWPDSPSLERDHRLAPEPARFTGIEIVITEKLDGANVLLHQGEVYSRSTAKGPARNAPWLGIVKKHHAWRTSAPALASLLIYGEDLYGVHSIEYDPVPEDETFRVFATAGEGRVFHSWDKTASVAAKLGMTTVPLLFAGTVQSRAELTRLLQQLHAGPSRLGGQREGMVVRTAGSFNAADFPLNVCKSVRAGHVQTPEHWTRNWRTCKIKPGS